MKYRHLLFVSVSTLALLTNVPLSVPSIAMDREDGPELEPGYVNIQPVSAVPAAAGEPIPSAVAEDAAGDAPPGAPVVAVEEADPAAAAMPVVQAALPAPTEPVVEAVTATAAEASTTKDEPDLPDQVLPEEPPRVLYPVFATPEGALEAFSKKDDPDVPDMALPTPIFPRGESFLRAADAAFAKDESDVPNPFPAPTNPGASVPTSAAPAPVAVETDGVAAGSTSFVSESPSLASPTDAASSTYSSASEGTLSEIPPSTGAAAASSAPRAMEDAALGVAGPADDILAARVPPAAVPAALPTDITQLQRTLEEIVHRTRDAAFLPQTAPRTFVIGPTGSGKSIFIHWLAGVPLTATRGSRGLSLQEAYLLPGFTIGHGFNVGTKLPAFWYDAAPNNVTYCDCPGFGDPDGEDVDIRNSVLINSLFKDSPRAKVLLVIPEASLIETRATHFLKLLNEVVGIFPNTEQLKQALCLVFTKHGEFTNISNLLTECHGLNSPLLSPAAQNVLGFLVRHREARVGSFPVPTRVGEEYRLGEPESLTLREIVTANTRNTMEFPEVRINLSPASQIRVIDLAHKLNEDIVHSVRTDGEPGILQRCRMLKDAHAGPIEDLRSAFAQTVTTLDELHQTPQEAPMTFVTVLSSFFDTEVIRRSIESIGSLKNLKDEITYRIADWMGALVPAIQQVRQMEEDARLQGEEEAERVRIAEAERVETARLAELQRLEDERVAEVGRVEAARVAEAERVETARIEAERQHAEDIRVREEEERVRLAELERARILEAERVEAERAEAARQLQVKEEELRVKEEQRLEQVRLAEAAEQARIQKAAEDKAEMERLQREATARETAHLEALAREEDANARAATQREENARAETARVKKEAEDKAERERLQELIASTARETALREEAAAKDVENARLRDLAAATARETELKERLAAAEAAAKETARLKKEADDKAEIERLQKALIAAPAVVPTPAPAPASADEIAAALVRLQPAPAPALTPQQKKANRIAAAQAVQAAAAQAKAARRAANQQANAARRARIAAKHKK